LSTVRLEDPLTRVRRLHSEHTCAPKHSAAAAVKLVEHRVESGLGRDPVPLALRSWLFGQTQVVLVQR
jgi:hypothetical protein